MVRGVLFSPQLQLTRFRSFTHVHRVQGGDITCHDGRGGRCAHGDGDAEKYVLEHTGAGTVSMFQSIYGVASQFFVCLCAAPWLDKKHVVFGKVTGGMEVVMAIDVAGHHSFIQITSCGVV